MKYCRNCNVDVRGDEVHCPLCQSKLLGTEEDGIYPPMLTVFAKYSLYFKQLLFVTGTVSIISLAVNLAIPESGHWALLIILGVTCFWISLVLGVRHMTDLMHIIRNQTLIISVLSVFWDWIIGWHGWSVNYVIPITCLIAVALMEIFIKVRHIPAADYILCITVNTLFGIVPLLLFFTGVVTKVAPTMVCMSISAIMLLRILLFRWAEIKAELIRRFHL